jgi:hypothetical protein
LNFHPLISGNDCSFKSLKIKHKTLDAEVSLEITGILQNIKNVWATELAAKRRRGSQSEPIHTVILFKSIYYPAKSLLNQRL